MPTVRLPHRRPCRASGFGRGFLPRHTEHGTTRRRRGATWFAPHHRGGRAVLHPRHAGPVAIRAWPARMDEFTGALKAGYTWKVRDTDPRSDLRFPFGPPGHR